MDMNEATAKAIGAERSIASLTVRELAAAAGIPERSLMRVLQAERDIKVNQVAAIATALGIYPHELIEHAERILERQSEPGRDARVVKLPERPRIDIAYPRPDTPAVGEDDIVEQLVREGFERADAERLAARRGEHDE